MAPMRPIFGTFVAVLALSCAHVSKVSGLKELKDSADTFHQRIRWHDFRGANELLVPALRPGFERGLRERHDERDLSITDYDLEDVRMAADGVHGLVSSRVNWVRLPDTSEHTERVSTLFVFQSGVWFVEQQAGGPFAKDLKGEATDGGLPASDGIPAGG